MRRAANFLAGLSGSCVTFIMLITTVDVLGRQFFTQSVPGSLEMSRLALVAAVYLAFAAAEVQGRHVEVTLVTSRLPRGWARLAGVVRALVILSFTGLMAWNTATETLQSIEKGEYTTGLLQLPVWPAKVAIPVGIAAYGVAVGLRMVRPAAAAPVEADQAPELRGI